MQDWGDTAKHQEQAAHMRHDVAMVVEWLASQLTAESRPESDIRELVGSLHNIIQGRAITVLCKSSIEGDDSATLALEEILGAQVAEQIRAVFAQTYRKYGVEQFLSEAAKKLDDPEPLPKAPLADRMRIAMTEILKGAIALCDRYEAFLRQSNPTWTYEGNHCDCDYCKMHDGLVKLNELSDEVKTDDDRMRWREAMAETMSKLGIEHIANREE